MKLRSDPINTFNYETLKRQFQTTLMKSKTEHYETCAEILNANKGSDFWKVKNLFTRTRETIPMGCLVSNGKVLESDADKFEHLRATFFSDSHLHGNMFDKSCLRNVEDKLTANLHPDYLQPLSIQRKKEELDSPLKESQTSKKSSDLDGIHPLMLRHTGTFFKIACFKLFNLCLHAGTYIWNLGKVILLRKPYKEDYIIANSDRPITLTSYVGKLFERIIERRVTNDLEAKGLIDDSQEGFRKRRGTGRCNYNFLDNIQNIIEQRKVAAALFIDVEKAFDSIWIDGLMYKLREAGINSYILNIIDHYLRNRNVYIEIGENRSESFKPKVGLPQGSILSPILFIFYFAEMFQECKGKIEKYADDATHVSAGDSIEEALSHLQKHCEEITNWIGKWRLKTSGPKTEVVIFSSIREEIREPTKNIVLQGNTIKFATESTALGITIDNKLNFRAQFEKCSRKAEKDMRALEPLVQNQFITPSTILKLMNCVEIPVRTYLSHIWANPTAFRTSSIWYKILSKSSNTKYKHELTKMEYICSQFPIDLEIQLSQAKFAQKAVLTLTSVQEPYQTTIAKYRGHDNPASRIV